MILWYSLTIDQKFIIYYIFILKSYLLFNLSVVIGFVSTTD